MKTTLFLSLTLCFCVTLSFAQTYPLEKVWVTYTNNQAPQGPDLNNGIATDSEGNVYITKAHNATELPMELGSLSKFSSDGELLWTTSTFGNAEGLVIDNFGNPIISGYTPLLSGIATAGAFQEDFGGGSIDGYLMKFNPEGERIWGTYFGGSGNDVYFSLPNGSAIYYIGLAVTQDNDIIWATYMQSEDMATTDTFQPEKNGASYVLSKFSAAGMREWTTYYGTEDSRYSITGIQTDSSGIYISGAVENRTNPNSYFDTFGDYIFQEYKQELFLSKFDYSGNREWSRYFSGNGQNTAKRYGLLLNGSYLYLALATNSTDLGTIGTSFPDYSVGFPGLLAKFDQDGTFIWGTYLPPTVHPVYTMPSVIPQTDQGIYVVGATKAIPNGPLEMFIPENENTFDPYVMKFDENGIMEWGNYVGGSDGEEYGYMGMALHENKIYIQSQSYDGGIISTPGAFQENPNSNNNNTFLARFDSETVGIESNVLSSFSVYPNPASTELFIAVNEKASHPVTIELHTITGQRVRSISLNEKQGSMDVSTLSSGIYFLSLEDQVQKKTKKIVIK